MDVFTQPADHLADLTPAQHEAVTHFEGPLLVLAGPGSGKTRVITRRIVHLLREGVKPYQILAITFTNKAARVMKDRVEQLMPGGKLWISTFHSMGARLLRMYAPRLGLEPNFTIYDQNDRNRLVKAALEASRIDNVRFTADRIEGAISKAKNQLLTPERYARQAGDFFSQTVAEVYPVYQKKLHDANAVDFDDLLLLPALALKHDPELRSELDARFRFVLVDEYQDTNSAQYAIVRGLSLEYPNLCVVGDPDQSIYKWRGSDIRNILDFERDYPQTRVIVLDKNYRSTKTILEAADGLIAHNKARKVKKLVPHHPAGAPVRVLTFESGQEEAHGIARRIRDAVKEGKFRYRDFAVFLRVNALSRGLETFFIQLRIPYQIVKGLAFFERKENKDILAYVRLALNERDDLSFLRAVNEPARGIGKVSLEHLQAYAEPREISLLAAAREVDKVPGLKGKAAGGLRGFAQLFDDLNRFKEGPPDELIRQVLDLSGYRQMLRSSTDLTDQDRLANIEELITAAKQYAAEDPAHTIGDFLENVTLASDVDGWNAENDCVSIMTLHSAKGLEFPVVYMVAVEQGLLPHERSLVDDGDVEEERRLAFVGMTRAEQELYLTHVKMREFRGQTLYAVPSMFLDELPQSAIELVDLSSSTFRRTRVLDDWRGGGSSDADPGWEEAGIQLRRDEIEHADYASYGGKKSKPPATAPAATAPVNYVPGMYVRHDSYGVGEVTQVLGFGEAMKIKIRFSKAGERTFLAAKARLAVLKK